MTSFRSAVPLVVSLAALLAIPGARPASAALPGTITLRNFFGTMTFDRPVSFAEFPGRDSVYMVLENPGRILVVRRSDTSWVKSVFDSIPVTGANGPSLTEDGGLLGFAFHPNYQANGKFYAYYTADGNPGAIYLVEGAADSTRLKASAAPKRRMLRLQKTLLYHNGGTLAFGTDGYLYVSVGDGGFAGGNAGDPENRAQNMASVFGKMLRIDVDGADAFPADTTRNYAYPADNPFVNTAGAYPEIWALGLRSPWKWNFRQGTQEIWLGNVGNFDWEEVEIITKGANMGWKILEGPACFPPGTATCDTAGLTKPVLPLGRTPATALTASSVTGGVFYRNDAVPSPFQDTYFFGDYVSTGRIFAVKFNGRTPTDTLVVTTNFPRVSSFNLDSGGRLFAVSHAVGGTTVNTGTIRILESPDMPYGTPVSIRKHRDDAGLPSLSLAELRRNPGRYVLRGLDGRAIHGTPSGTFLVSLKGSANPPRLMTVVW
jgi:glucose/arabinose dehydrogenase